MDRRKFLHLACGSVVGISGLRNFQSQGRSTEKPLSGKTLEKRPLGKTGEKLSIVGLGGLVLASETQEDARLFYPALEVARSFIPLSGQEENDVRRLASSLNPLFELHPGS